MFDADYLVVGAGAMGMAFTDALIDHAADARVAIIDRRHTVGGHWLNAYPFVRLHQASAFYGVASTVLGGRVQQRGPEAGLHERATQPEICAYFGRVLSDRLAASGRVEFFGSCEYMGDRTFVSRLSGRSHQVPERCRIVDARYLAPDIPAETRPPFDVVGGSRVIPVNDLPQVAEPASQYVIIGSGKTGTDACVWLLTKGVDPDAICWVRPRDAWMFNRSVIQPEPAIFLGMVADTMQVAESATSLEDLFLGLEDAGILFRTDRSVMPTMAKTPTLGAWELELLRSIKNVVRLGHVEQVTPDKLVLTRGSIAIDRDALVVHCAAAGLKYPPLVPIWRPEMITLQPIRAGYPCFGAALAGYVEATRSTDEEKNWLCPPSPYPNSMQAWARMTAVGARNAMKFGSKSDIADWANRVALNPSRIPPDHPESAALDNARERLQTHMGPGLDRLSELARL